MSATIASPADLLDADFAVEALLRYLAIDRVTGEEAAISAAITMDLLAVGVARENIRNDDAHTRIPVPTEVGNLIAELPGTVPGPRLLFSTHLDTVPLCRGAKPRREGGRIVSDGTTALGGDNGTGCAVLVALAKTLLDHKLPHPPITLLFTVREESGLHGAREMHAAELKGAAMGFNVDSNLASVLTIGAVGQTNWEAVVKGRASHAGAFPERGISATLVASIALAETHRAGWWGRVVKGQHEGSSNAGIFAGKDGKAAGDATNVVTDYVRVVGEARSLDADFAASIAEGYRAAFQHAAGEVMDVGGDVAQVTFEAVTSYPPFKMDANTPAVAHATRAAKSLGLTPEIVLSKGGLDANWLVGHGVPTVTFGAGQAEIHTVREYVDVAEFVTGCRMAVALATMPA